MDIRVVRALWGKLEWFKDEIPKEPLFNDLAIVFGKENFEYLSSLGYDCILASSDAKIKDPNSIEGVVEVYQHKLEALEIAMKVHNNILFLQDEKTHPHKPVFSES